MAVTERGQVCDVVVDIFDGEGQDLDAHPADVGCCHLADERRELVSVLVNLLNGQRAWNGNGKRCQTMDEQLARCYLDPSFPLVLLRLESYASCKCYLHSFLLTCSIPNSREC